MDEQPPLPPQVDQDDDPNVLSSLEHKAAELKTEFALLLEAVLVSSAKPQARLDEIGVKLSGMFDDLELETTAASPSPPSPQREMCRICLEPVPNGTRFALLESCDHAHCEPCFRAWLTETGTRTGSGALPCSTCRVASSRVAFHAAHLTSAGPDKAAIFDTVLNLCQHSRRNSPDFLFDSPSPPSYFSRNSSPMDQDVHSFGSLRTTRIVRVLEPIDGPPYTVGTFESVNPTPSPRSSPSGASVRTTWTDDHRMSPREILPLSSFDLDQPEPATEAQEFENP